MIFRYDFHQIDNKKFKYQIQNCIKQNLNSIQSFKFRQFQSPPFMDNRRQNDSNKSTNKSQRTSSSSKKKRQNSGKLSRSKEDKYNIDNKNITLSQNYIQNKSKKSGTLIKKKIQDIKNPDLMIKATYKNKKLSIPLSNLENQSLTEIINPHIIRFQHQILKNFNFDPNNIEGWKTLNPSDVLKDYYFQTQKPIKCFKGQILEIEPIWKQAQKNRIKLPDFQIIRCIGTGGFSRVFLSRYLPTGKFYALKLMEKQGLLQSGKQCVVINQRDIMVDLDNPQILQLEFAFQTKHFVALALQYCPGGQLFYYLRRVKRMTQDQARYCFVQIAMGIQYLHTKKIIYRDIKPQNIMIDKDGNLKIADFGLSRKDIRPSQLTYTFCGSPEYMAPQMLAKSGHTFSVDYYCLGALLYQLVTGSPPFYSRDVQKIYYSIQNQQIDFPPHVQLSGQIRMLLQGLLIKDPKKRLGSLGGIRQILGHPWVRKIKPADITNKTIQTPIKIDLLTFNINQEQIDQSQNNFADKFQDQNQDFQQNFNHFYFNRHINSNFPQQILPSTLSQNSKQNKTITQKLQTFKSKQKNNGNKTHSRQQLAYPISLNKNALNIAPKGCSQSRKLKPKNILPSNSNNKISLVIKGRKRDNKSITKNQKIKPRVQSPKLPTNNSNKALKRIKSTALLHDKVMIKNNHYQ